MLKSGDLCLNMVMNLNILKMGPALFARHFIREALRTRQVKMKYSLPHAYAVFCGRFIMAVNSDYLYAPKHGFGWLVGFVALRPKSTAMVIAGRSVHLTTLFPKTW